MTYTLTLDNTSAASQSEGSPAGAGGFAGIPAATFNFTLTRGPQNSTSGDTH